jgi:hypothetical protein
MNCLNELLNRDRRGIMDLQFFTGQRRPVWTDGPVRILPKVRVRIRSSERMSVMPNDMEKLVENFRAIRNRRSLQKDQRLIIYDCKTWPLQFLHSRTKW